MINLGIRGHDVVADSPASLGKRIHSYGLTNLQLAPAKSFPRLVSDTGSLLLGAAAHIGSELVRQGVFISVLGCYVNISSENETVRKRAVDDFKSHIRACHAFGANMVGTETGSVKEGWCEENFTDEAYAVACASVAEMVACAEGFGVTVAIEPGLNHPIYSVDRLHQLVRDIRSDHLRVILDFANLVSPETLSNQRNLMEEAFEKLDGHIEHFHIKDCVAREGRMGTAPVGTGAMDFLPVLQYVKKARPMTSMTFEETTEKDLPAAIRHIQTLYDSI